MEDAMIFVQQMLSQKGDSIYSVAPDATLNEVLEVMFTHDIGVVVVLESGNIKGIFSERDFTRAYAAKERPSLDEPVSALMTHEVISVNPEASIDDCMILMTGHHIRHLPVVDNGVLVGLISIGDLVKELIAERDGTIRGLENYILGTDYNR
jgi:CBS domain-containing protein